MTDEELSSLHHDVPAGLQSLGASLPQASSFFASTSLRGFDCVLLHAQPDLPPSSCCASKAKNTGARESQLLNNSFD